MSTVLSTLRQIAGGRGGGVTGPYSWRGIMHPDCLEKSQNERRVIVVYLVSNAALLKLRQITGGRGREEGALQAHTLGVG